MRPLSALLLAGALFGGVATATEASRPGCTNVSCRTCQATATVALLFGQTVYCPADQLPQTPIG